MNKFQTAMLAKQSNNTLVRVCRKSDNETLDWLTLNGTDWTFQQAAQHNDVRKMIDTNPGENYVAVLAGDSVMSPSDF